MTTTYAAPQPIPLSVLDPDSPWAMVFDQANLAIAVLGPDFAFLRVNHAFAVVDGKGVDYFLGRNYFDLYPDDGNEAIFRRVASTGTPHTSLAMPFAPANNPKRGINYWNWTLTPIKGRGTDEHSHVACLILTMQDVSTRVRAEERARLAESDVRNLLHNLPGMLYRTFPDPARDLLINAEPLTGYTASEIRALPGKWLDLVHPDDRASVESGADALRLRAGERVQCYRIVTHGGGVVWVEDHQTSLFDDTGRHLGVEGTVFDISQRKRQEALNLANEERYRNLLETSLDGYWFVDGEGRLLDVNPAYCRMSGYRREELLGMRIPDLEAGQSAAAACAHLEHAIRHGGELFETRHRRKDGSVWRVEINAAWYPRVDGRFFVFLRDIDQRQRAGTRLAPDPEPMPVKYSVCLSNSPPPLTSQP